MNKFVCKIFYVVIAIFIINPCFANPTVLEQAYAQDLPAPPSAQNVQLQPLNDIEQVDAPSSSSVPSTIQQSIEEETLYTKPSTGEIEKNSSQEPYDKSNLAQQIMPETKNELLRAAIMFLKVMMAVIACSAVIYFLLLLVKKFYSPQITEQAPDSKEDLKSPQGESDALRNFLNQTKNH